ncbi:MAG TPA: hypothetical protein VFQ71_11325, partial [Gaiellales bacterium]|nr:hypothetical protein [Gaiellales bacterium]
MDAPPTTYSELAPVGLALDYLAADDDFAAFARRAATEAVRARVSEALLPAFTAALWRSLAGGERAALAVVVDDDDAARTLAEAAAAFLPGSPVAYIPSRGAVYGDGLDPAPHLVGERFRALATLEQGGLVAVSADALIERLPAPADRPQPVRLRPDDEVDRDGLLQHLADSGYERADTVEERGQFSVRGGLIDVFATTGREPVRIELDGDRVERLSAFSVFTQRSLRDLDEVAVFAAAEPGALEAAWGSDEGAPAIPSGMVAIAPELTRLAVVAAWNPDSIAGELEEAEAEIAERLRDP